MSWSRACVVVLLVVLTGSCSTAPERDTSSWPDPDAAEALYLVVTTDDGAGPELQVDGGGLVLAPRDVAPSDTVVWPYVATARLDRSEVEQVRAVLDGAGLLDDSPPELVAEREAAGPDVTVTEVTIETGDRIWSHRLVPGPRLTMLLQDLGTVIDSAEQLTVPPPQVGLRATAGSDPAPAPWPHPTVGLAGLRQTCALEGDLAVAVAETLQAASGRSTFEDDGVVYTVTGGPVVVDVLDPSRSLPRCEVVQG